MILGARNSGARTVVRIHVFVLAFAAGPEDFWDLAAVRGQSDSRWGGWRKRERRQGPEVTCLFFSVPARGATCLW